MRAVRRARAVTLQAEDRSGFEKIGVVGGTMHVMATEAGHAPCIHETRNKVVALHAVLVSGAVCKVCERRLAELVFFQLPEILEIPAGLETHGPVPVFSRDRIFQRAAL